MFGAPVGAFGASNGAQSGVESRISTLMTPLNGIDMTRSLLMTRDAANVCQQGSTIGRDPPPNGRPTGDGMVAPQLFDLVRGRHTGSASAGRPGNRPSLHSRAS